MLKENSRCSDASDVIPMFPTLVWKAELEAQLHEAIDAKALAALSRVSRDLPLLAPGEGWQSIQTLHVLDNFQDLISCAHPVASDPEVRVRAHGAQGRTGDRGHRRHNRSRVGDEAVLQHAGEAR